MKFSFHSALPDKQKQGHKRERVCARVLWADGSHAVLWKSPLSTLFNRPYKTDSLLKYLTQEKRERQRREEERTTLKINKTALCDWCAKTMPDISVTINKCGRGHKGPNFKKGGKEKTLSVASSSKFQCLFIGADWARLAHFFNAALPRTPFWVFVCL